MSEMSIRIIIIEWEIRIRKTITSFRFQSTEQVWMKAEGFFSKFHFAMQKGKNRIWDNIHECPISFLLLSKKGKYATAFPKPALQRTRNDSYGHY